MTSIASSATAESGSEERIVPYHCGRLRGMCVEGYEAFDLTTIPWDELRRRDDPHHALAKASRTRCVVRLEFAPPGRPPRTVFAKRVLLKDWRKRLGCLFVPSKARHEWESGRRLLSGGIAAARPVVCAELRRGPWLLAGFLVTEEIAGARPFDRELERAAGARERRALFAPLARWLWEAHRRGFYHDDCSAQHVFLDSRDSAAPGGPRRFWFIDLDNCRFHRATVPWRRRVKNLFQVLRSLAPPRASRVDRFHFIDSYLKASGETGRLREAVALMRRLARAKDADVRL